MPCIKISIQAKCNTIKQNEHIHITIKPYIHIQWVIAVLSYLAYKPYLAIVMKTTKVILLCNSCDFVCIWQTFCMAATMASLLWLKGDCLYYINIFKYVDTGIDSGYTV